MGQASDPKPEDRLVQAGPGTDMDHAVREDLDKIRLDSLLAQQDASTELTREIEESIRAPLAVAEIAGVLDRLESPVFAELEGLMGGSEVNGLQVEKHLLAELLSDGAESAAILKRGLAFLKHKRYANAVEWWSLHRRNLDAKTSRLYLLLLIMEALTRFWAGEPERAAALRDQILSHQLYRSMGRSE